MEVPQARAAKVDVTNGVEINNTRGEGKSSPLISVVREVLKYMVEALVYVSFCEASEGSASHVAVG